MRVSSGFGTAEDSPATGTPRLVVALLLVPVVFAVAVAGFVSDGRTRDQGR